MDKQEFGNASYEVLKILEYIKDDDLKRIPQEEIEILKKNANYNHDFHYNPDKKINEQSVSKLTKGIIAQYFYKYIATEKQKEKIRRAKPHSSRAQSRRIHGTGRYVQHV